MSVVDLPLPASLADLGVTPGTRGELLSLVAVRRAEGSCTDALGAFVMGNLYLQGGTALAREAPDRPFTVREGASIAQYHASRNDPHPEVPGAEFVMGFRAGYRREGDVLTTNWLGLWRGPKGDFVQAYKQAKPGEFKLMRKLLTSSSRLRSVTYFPAPDTPSGRIGLVQDHNGGEVRLISIDWSHPGLF
jgi:hypothetical protein